MLQLPRFDPEMGRIVGEIGKHSHEVDTGSGTRQGLVHRAVEIGDERDDEIGLRLAPMLAQALRQGSVAQANERLKQLELLRQPQGPAAREPLVVIILGIHAGRSAKNTGRIEHLEEVDEPDMKGTPLLAQHRLEGCRRRAMAAARIEVDQVDRLQGSRYGQIALPWLGDGQLASRM